MFTHPLHRHCSFLLSGVPILVALSASCQLEFVDFRRRTPAGWRGARAGSLRVQNWMLCWVPCSAPDVSYKAWPAALVPSASSSLPVYRALVVLPVVQQYARFAPTQIQFPRNLRSLSFVPLSLSLPLSSLCVLPSVSVGPLVCPNAEEEVPRGFLQASS